MIIIIIIIIILYYSCYICMALMMTGILLSCCVKMNKVHRHPKLVNLIVLIKLV